MNTKDNHINYVEFNAKDLEKIKEFYTAAFGWTFTDYGPDYCAFSESGLDGGYERSEKEIVNGALIVLYHKNLESIKNRIIKCHGRISKDIFSFPGGQRFHFKDPAGNELAVWTDEQEE
jgi:predicted enzyme related to lactoylglutathione lyase